VGHLQVPPVGPVTGQPHRGDDELEHLVAVVLRDALDEGRHRLVDLRVTRPVAGEVHGRSGAASSASGCSGRAPRWEITSDAASAPTRPHVTGSAPRVNANRNPAAYWSPAPVVSTTAPGTGCTATSCTPSGVTTTDPWGPRVSAATSQCRDTSPNASSKRSTRYRAPISASLPNS